ncbi:GNAT family N-acetyltransferase [Streptomyces sp. NPDC051940]|uniref:GNAT family N-acetyltransferase n=1 Tax=Streptomyces sp. NPDC051940 TaxID=3155675 RepID=UPI0034247233
MLLEPLAIEGGDLPAPLRAELAGLYASNVAFFTLSGDFPDPLRITAEQVAASVRDDLAHDGAEYLLARDGDGALVGIAATAAVHPDPADPYPWIGLLLVHGERHREGLGGRLAGLVEDRFRAAGRPGVRLAVLENNPKGLAFWTARGYEVVDRRLDRGAGRPCVVMEKRF